MFIIPILYLNREFILCWTVSSRTQVFLKKYHCPHENEKTSKDHARQEAMVHTFQKYRKKTIFQNSRVHMNAASETAGRHHH